MTTLRALLALALMLLAFLPTAALWQVWRLIFWLWVPVEGTRGERARPAESPAAPVAAPVPEWLRRLGVRISGES